MVIFLRTVIFLQCANIERGRQPTATHDISGRAVAEHAGRKTNDCLPLADFGQLDDDGIPRIINDILPLLSRHLNSQHWLHQIADSFAEGFSTPTEMRSILGENVDEMSLRKILLILLWFFRSVQECSHRRPFIDRAQDERECE